MSALGTPRLVIAGTNSGVGKTTVTSGLCGAFRRLGLRVSVFKCGPDYLDPTFHWRAAGSRSQTLDGWMMGRDGVRATFQNFARDADIALIEGLMGLFDGMDPASDVGSTAEIAKWLEAPVVLVVDAAGMSRSLAALSAGFASFDSGLHVAGVICNRVGSQSHLDVLRAASASVPVLGGLPKDPEHAFPQRHLGLRTADEDVVPGASFAAWAGHVEQWCDLERILGIARGAPPLTPAPPRASHGRPRSCRIGMAYDEAFHFYYDENLRLLEEAGAQLVRFSPVHDARLPAVDGLYFGGGYPEAHAASLAANQTLRGEVLAFCESGKPVYAECGGLMYLCGGIRQLDGSRQPMVGWFGADAVMSGKLQALGYVEVVTRGDTILGPAGQLFRGHQFRYSSLEWTEGSESAYDMRRGRDGQRSEEGYRKGRVLASYIHAHWASNPALAGLFVAACAA